MTFSELIQTNKPILVDFYADWCTPCRMMKPILEKVKQKMGNEATIIKINVDKNQSSAAAYNITSIPTLMIFRNGKIWWKQAGMIPANQLIKHLKTL